jgi:hypothetical protein
MQDEIKVEEAINIGIWILFVIAIFCMSLVIGFTMAESRARNCIIKMQVAQILDLKTKNTRLIAASDISSVLDFMFPDLIEEVSKMNEKLRKEANKKGLKSNWGAD